MCNVIRTVLVTCMLSSIPILVGVLQFLHLWTDYVVHEVFFPSFQDGDTYDFIVGKRILLAPGNSWKNVNIPVGAGSAGAVLVNRLSKHHRVLALEAGGSANFLTEIPGMAMLMLHQPSVDWKHETVPQNKSCLKLRSQKALWPRGKVLGGSSVLNYMIYIRGNRLDYENWARVTGSEEWNYENVLPYFKKSENYKGLYSNDTQHHGQLGELSVSDVNYTPLLDNFLRAGKELGYDTVDFNGRKQQGFGVDQVTAKGGSRWSTYKAFIEPVLHRENLKVLKYSTVEKVHFDKNNRAYGVTFKRHGRRRFARASKEVILSAGAIDSPKILMLSGVGPKKHLQSIGIKVLADLPVGKNLQDHPASVCGPILIDPPKSFIPERDLTFSTYYDYIVKGVGPLSSTTGLQALAFIESSLVKGRNESWPDIQLYMVGLGIYSNIATDIATMVGMDVGHVKHLLLPHVGRDAFYILTSLVRPRSRGEILLADADPATPPLIDPRYFEDEADLKALTEGLMECSKMAKETQAFRELNATFVPRQPDDCAKYKPQSREAFECFAKGFTSTLYHPAGTARMGKVGDPETVVDPYLRVVHTKGLRVIDASVMPLLVNGNTNAPTIMIGEKGAYFIRAYWAQQYEVCLLYPYITYQDNLPRCYYSRFS